MYPPGIPLVIAGEKLTPEKIEALLALQRALRSEASNIVAEFESLESGKSVTGCSDSTLQSLLVYFRE